jgi:hypothetical protein
MIFSRHTLVAVLVIAAVVSVFFSPLVPTSGPVTRHHARANLAIMALALHIQPRSAVSFFSSAAPGARAIHSEILLALNCARLC